MSSLLTIVMVILALIIIFECIAQKRVPSNFVEWLIIIAACILVINPGR